MKINNLYSLEFLPIAKKDIDDIVFYISNILNNKSAAYNLQNNIRNVLECIMLFPYSLPVYKFKNNMDKEYRCAIVNNYSLFYTVDEANYKIIVTRIVYSKMNINNIHMY